MTNESREKAATAAQQSEEPQVVGAACGRWIGLDGETRKHIGRMLKATYDEVAHEPVPDKFLELLKQLEAAEPRKR
jgi:hypothetical protein